MPKEVSKSAWDNENLWKISVLPYSYKVEKRKDDGKIN